ncbi:Os02g0299000 [Oryza sativa Japonica Group]|uniref:non-specific serine/threonine protein kinase n=1 Tax=Oryza sativa subsp. japonica TaxID=39947 RepID=A0A0P0VHY6_ORYSJ|nr:Os02g0299000 [Oryza sativa Japonica Group]
MASHRLKAMRSIRRRCASGSRRPQKAGRRRQQCGLSRRPLCSASSLPPPASVAMASPWSSPQPRTSPPGSPVHTWDSSTDQATVTTEITSSRLSLTPSRTLNSPTSTATMSASTSIALCLQMPLMPATMMTTPIDVRLASVGIKKPFKPLVSTRFNLSAVITDEAYVGFSASIGTMTSQHYVLGWSFGVGTQAPAIDMDKLPRLPGRRSKKSYRPKTIVIALPIVSVVLVIAVAAGVFLLIKRKFQRYVELREDWELEFGAHRLSYKDLLQATERFNNKNLLGIGGFGRVYKGVLPTSSSEVAVKRVSHDSRQGIKEFVAEVASIGRLRHRNLVQLFGYCRLKKELLLVYDYMPNGSLDKYLYSHDDKPTLNWAQRFQIIKGIASGLLYLHEEWEQIVIHRDIKPSNVLLDNDMNGRLGDFGLARLYNRDTELQTTVVAGTFGYMAPELALTGKASPLTDVFAFGAFLLEVTSGRRPVEQDIEGHPLLLTDWVFEHCSNEQILAVIDPRLNGNINISEASLVLKLGLLCSHPMSNVRPTMRQVVQYLNGDMPLPEMSPMHFTFSLSALMQNQGFDSSSKSLGTISTLSIGR